MENKSIREVASYWGAPCTYTVMNPVASTVEDFICMMTTYRKSYGGQGEVSDFKILLRPISSLTDEEVRACFMLAFPEFRSAEGCPINRDATGIYINALTITTGQSLFADTTFGLEPIDNPGAIVAYFQSIGVYVPGTIDEKYVKLI